MKTYKSADQIKVGVIGYGGAFNMGKAHLSMMQAVGMVPTAVCEIDPERLKVAEADFPGIRQYSSVDEMLKDSELELVTIITPHNTHASLGRQCLEAGKHVVCEKPLAITLEECDDMIAAARENDLLLSTFHNRHWDGCILEAVEKIRKEKVIGDVVRVEAHMGGYGKPGDWWRSNRKISGGIHYDWGVHLLEYSLQLIDSEMVEISGFAHTGLWETRWGADTNEDEVSAIVRFSNGTLLNLRITSMDAAPPEGRLQITGTKGKYIFHGGDYEIIKAEDGWTKRMRRRNRDDEQQKYYENVAAALTGKAELIITPEWSRRPIQILDLATRSAREGRALPAVHP